MSYQSDIKKHLSDYKRMVFAGFPNGFWIRSKPPKMLTYAFLPKDEDENLIKYYQNDFLKSHFNVTIKRHMYFHHMNSSQAMCINFFFPLFNELQLDLVLEFLGFHSDRVDYKTVAFEKESHIDKKANYRPTNFDFYFETESGKKFYFEIKYTEQEFGKAPADKDHINKYRSIYSKHLSLIDPMYQNQKEFLDNYQLMRNIIHVDKDSYVIFIYPRDNKRIKLGASN